MLQKSRSRRSKAALENEIRGLVVLKGNQAPKETCLVAAEITASVELVRADRKSSGTCRREVFFLEVNNTEQVCLARTHLSATFVATCHAERCS